MRGLVQFNRLLKCARQGRKDDAILYAALRNLFETCRCPDATTMFPIFRDAYLCRVSLSEERRQIVKDHFSTHAGPMSTARYQLLQQDHRWFGEALLASYLEHPPRKSEGFAHSRSTLRLVDDSPLRASFDKAAWRIIRNIFFKTYHPVHGTVTRLVVTQMHKQCPDLLNDILGDLLEKYGENTRMDHKQFLSFVEENRPLFDRLPRAIFRLEQPLYNPEVRRQLGSAWKSTVLIWDSLVDEVTFLPDWGHVDAEVQCRLSVRNMEVSEVKEQLSKTASFPRIRQSAYADLCFGFLGMFQLLAQPYDDRPKPITKEMLRSPDWNRRRNTVLPHSRGTGPTSNAWQFIPDDLFRTIVMFL